ncbi:hypothetical protein GCM10011588_11730 [Nocardia jinanensis]|uniref:Uncharacterized protein n=1 Tax=Nocardia jinanensis TaxID=382504 RepID=A0A917VNI8_9NOCA|nr:hypothetical protein GCM10011588_11730 [Nocardia jinanensis]
MRAGGGREQQQIAEIHQARGLLQAGVGHRLPGAQPDPLPRCCGGTVHSMRAGGWIGESGVDSERVQESGGPP